MIRKIGIFGRNFTILICSTIVLYRNKHFLDEWRQEEFIAEGLHKNNKRGGKSFHLKGVRTHSQERGMKAWKSKYPEECVRQKRCFKTGELGDKTLSIKVSVGSTEVGATLFSERSYSTPRWEVSQYSWVIDPTVLLGERSDSTPRWEVRQYS